ncbi:unnamed protein product [Musa acuminata var. zebrina]
MRWAARPDSPEVVRVSEALPESSFRVLDFVFSQVLCSNFASLLLQKSIYLLFKMLSFFLFRCFICLLFGEGELYRCVKSTVSFDFDLDLVLFCALQHVFSSLLVKLRISEWSKEEKNIRSTVMVY